MPFTIEKLTPLQVMNSNYDDNDFIVIMTTMIHCFITRDNN